MHSARHDATRVRRCADAAPRSWWSGPHRRVGRGRREGRARLARARRGRLDCPCHRFLLEGAVMPRVQHLSARNGTSAPAALPVALRDGDFSGPIARLWRAGESCDRCTSPHASPCGRSTFFRQSRRNGATAAGVSSAAAPVGPCLRAAGAGIFFRGGVAQSVERPVVNRSVAGSSPALAASMGLRLCSQEQSPQQSASQRMKQPTAQSAGARPNGKAKADTRDSRRDGTTHTRAPRPPLLLLPVAAPAARGGARATFSLRGGA